MPIAEATITGVVSRTRERKSDGKSFTVYEITLNGQDKPKYQTFNREIAGQANRMLNQRAEIAFHVEQSGMFENHYIDDVRLPTNQDYYGGPQAAPPPTPPPIRDASADRDRSIWRQTAAKVSAHLSSSPVEFWSNVDDLVTYFQTGSKPDRFQRFVPPEARDMSQPVQAQNGNQFIPQEAYAQSAADHSFGPNPDDDIPF